MHGNDNYQSLMVPLEREKYTWGLGYIYNILCLKNKQKESKANTMICLKLVRRVYSFPVAAIQIITALVAYNTTNLSSYSSRAQKSKISLTGLKVSGRTPGDSPSGTSQDSSFPCLFQLLEVTCTPWLMNPFHLQSHWFHCSNLCFCHRISDSDSPPSLFHL